MWTIESIREAALEIRKKLNTISFRNDFNALRKARDAELQSMRADANVQRVETREAFNRAVESYQKDTKIYFDSRKPKVFEPAKWFLINTGDLKGAPEIYAMSINGGVVLSTGKNQGLVYIHDTRIYQVGDSYYLKGNSGWIWGDDI